MRNTVHVVSEKHVDAVTPYQSKVKGYRAKRLITKKRVGSERLMVGIIEIEPNSKGYSWAYSEAEGNDEVYYVLKGKVRLHYDDQYIDAEEGDAIFLPAGWKYQLDNEKPEMARLVYALTPPIE